MKNSYPDSLITLAAAITKACSLHVHSNEKGNSPVTTGVSTIHHSSINNNAVIGIKFDTMSARKYFVLIQTAQQNEVLNKTREKYDNLLLPIPPESGTKANTERLVTTWENELIEN